MYLSRNRIVKIHTILQISGQINKIALIRATDKQPQSERPRLDLTLTCQVLADGLSIHSLTRKTSYCQGTAMNKGGRGREGGGKNGGESQSS